MKTEIFVEHWKAVNSKPPGDLSCMEPFDWRTEKHRICGPTDELERACQQEPVTSINWPQSFARRKLPLASYAELKMSGFGHYYFRRIEGADRTLPAKVHFVWDEPEEDEPQPALQGDVLTYRHTELRLIARRIAHQRVRIPEAEVHRLKALGSIFTDQQVIKSLRRHLTQDVRTLFDCSFIEQWDPGSSFADIAY